MKKKGFTLVELLATIVVLSVIALIAVPIVINVIEKAKKSALVSSVNGLVESANIYYTNQILKEDITNDVIFDFEEGVQTSDNKLSYKGKVYNGKLILTSDSDVITCIDDGKYYAYKEKNSDEIVSGIGTCLYDGTTGDFTIESDVDVIQKECDEDKKELQEQITNLTTTVNNLQTTISEKEYEISNLESIIEGLENQVTVLEGEKQELINQLGNSNTSNNDLQQQITTLQEEITTLRGTIDSLNATITTLEGEKQALIEQLAASNKTNKELQTQIEELNNKITTLENEKQTLTEQLESSNETNSNLQKEITDLNSEITTLKVEKQELEERLAASNSELQEQIDELNAEIKTLKTTISNNETTIKNLTTEKNSLIAQLSTANSKITELEGTIDTLESSIEAKNNEITVLNGEKTDLQNQLTTKTNELKTLNENLGKVTASASDVLSGKTILTSSGLVTGSMANNGSISKTLNAGGSYTIPKGYHDGTGKVTANSLASQTKVDSGKTAITASQVLTGYQGWVNGSKISGTMANNGSVSKTLSINGSYTIPAGYHDGTGKVTQSITTKAAATYTPGTSNQTIASGQYLSGAQTIKGDSNLIASNIKTGTSIFGVTGTYTSDATATASQILSGKTAYVNGSKITGTMTNKSGTTTTASTVTESGTNALISIPSNGYYSTSSKISVPIETIKNEVSSLGNVIILNEKSGSTITYDIKSLYPSLYQKLSTSNFYLGVSYTVGYPYTNDSNDRVSFSPTVSYDNSTGILTVSANLYIYGWSSRGGSITVAPIIIY